MAQRGRVSPDDRRAEVTALRAEVTASIGNQLTG